MLDAKGKKDLDDILARYGVGTVLAVIAERLGGTVEVEVSPPMVSVPTMQQVRDANSTAPIGSELGAPWPYGYAPNLADEPKAS